MSINEIIRGAILPLVPVCEPGLYDGIASEYCTFQYSEAPAVLAEGEPDEILYRVQLHWFFPLGVNGLRKKVKIRRAILAAGCTYPSTVDASDAVSQHYVFEFDYADGDV